MNGGVLNKRIPTIFVFLFVFGIITPTVALINQESNFRGYANTNTEPTNIYIANINENSFTASFTTRSKTKALLLLNASNQTIPILDDRDKNSGIQKEYYSHFITVPNLTPKSNYSFKLLINEKEYDNEIFQVTTGSILNQAITEKSPIFGKAQLPNGESAGDALVVASFSDSQTLASITDESGIYSFSLENLRTSDMSSYLDLQEAKKIEIKIYFENFSTKIITNYSTSKDLPTVTLGENYKFSNIVEKTSSQSANFSSLISTPSSDVNFTDNASSPTGAVQITIPQSSDEQNVLSANDEKKFNNINTDFFNNISTIDFNDSFLLAGFSLFLIFLGVSLLFAL